MPWTFLASKDFIGPQWKTVKDTRHSRYWNAAFTLISGCFVVAYIVVQGLSEDYKEMSAALVAFVFSVLNFVRTLWGLWQLHCFRKWAINSINALEAMGVRYHIKNTSGIDSQKDSESKNGKDNTVSGGSGGAKEEAESSGRQESLKNREHNEASESADTVADRLLVNDTIVDNQVAHGEARCFLKCGNIELKGMAGKEVSFVGIICDKTFKQHLARTSKYGLVIVRLREKHV